jgi:branched-chain amino acid transport system permease protein
VAIEFLLFAFFGMGWNTIGGYAGQIELGKAMYVGIGAYTTAVAMVWWDVTPWVTLPVAVVLSILWSFMVGYPVFELRGHYFAIATIAISLTLQELFLDWDLVNGAAGLILPVKATPNLPYLQFVSQAPYYYLMFALCVPGLVYLNWLRRSKLGYQLQAIKENEELAASLGISIRWTKVKAYTIASVFASIGGWFYTVHRQFIDPNSVMSVDLSIKIALMAMLGGAGSLWGPVIGAAVLVPLDRYLGAVLGGQRAWRGMDFVIYGLIIMLISVVEPRGIWGLVQRAKGAGRRRMRGGRRDGADT